MRFKWDKINNLFQEIVDELLFNRKTQLVPH